MFHFNFCFFAICGILSECLCQLPGMCWDGHKSEIKKNNHQGKVLYVCSDSPISNITDTVYMDMAIVPRFENSTCYCTLIFTNENGRELNRVRLDYKIESFTDALTVNAFGYDRFNTQDNAHVIKTIIKESNVTFTLTSPGTYFKSCLRITSGNTFKDKNWFRVRCYSNLLTPVTDTSSSTNTLTPISTTSTESTIETGPGAVIGGAVGGGVCLVIVTVIAVLVLKRRKTKTDQRKDDDHYINEIGLNNVGNMTTDSANEGTYETPVANSVDENKYETLTANSADMTNNETLVANSVDENKYETLTANSADGTNYETLVSNSVDENKYEALTANSADGTNYKKPVSRSADDYKYANIAGQLTDESKYENVTENDNFSVKSTNNKAYVNEDVIQSIKK